MQKNAWISQLIHSAYTANNLSKEYMSSKYSLLHKLNENAITPEKFKQDYSQILSSELGLYRRIIRWYSANKHFDRLQKFNKIICENPTSALSLNAGAIFSSIKSSDQKVIEINDLLFNQMQQFEQIAHKPQAIAENLLRQKELLMQAKKPLNQTTSIFENLYNSLKSKILAAGIGSVYLYVGIQSAFYENKFIHFDPDLGRITGQSVADDIFCIGAGSIIWIVLLLILFNDVRTGLSKSPGKQDLFSNEDVKFITDSSKLD